MQQTFFRVRRIFSCRCLRITTVLMDRRGNDDYEGTEGDKGYEGIGRRSMLVGEETRPWVGDIERLRVRQEGSEPPGRGEKRCGDGRCKGDVLREGFAV